MAGAGTETRLERRVREAAEDAVRRRGAVSALDVLTGLGWVTDKAVQDWRQGRVDALDRLVQAPPEKRAAALEALRAWAERGGLAAEPVEYAAATRDRRPLRFTAEGSAGAELAHRTHWVSPQATAAQRRREEDRRAKAPDLVVTEVQAARECAECGESGTGPHLEEGSAVYCLDCADLGHLVFLPAGDAALTRRAKKASRLSAVVQRWVASRRKFRRTGLLVEEGALEEAEAQCLADEDARARRRERDAVRRTAQDAVFQGRFAEEIRAAFPGCPEERAERIAAHTALRGSGRVGRSAAGRDLDPGAVRRAVVASVRHEDTPYDDLLMSGVPRDEARARIAADIDRVLALWS
ncbi:DUF2293 domain-containing protein [Nocardiopsis potens]|uniref:DUF2293 domain-containing protein n=1 Tax=Nocardiopsis potens TaxID=1246458 RepID=UPI00034C8A6B|nr:DUF2293 domain-containing protein [Nocardiopsis potens]